MTALVDLVKVDEVRKGSFDPGSGRPKRFAWEYRECGTNRDFSLGNEAPLLPVEAGGRGSSVGKPVQRDVVKNGISCKTTLGLSFEGVCHLLVAVGVMVKQPGGQPDR